MTTIFPYTSEAECLLKKKRITALTVIRFLAQSPKLQLHPAKENR
jgi:hypothetical protein